MKEFFGKPPVKNILRIWLQYTAAIVGLYWLEYAVPSGPCAPGPAFIGLFLLLLISGFVVLQSFFLTVTRKRSLKASLPGNAVAFAALMMVLRLL